MEIYKILDENDLDGEIWRIVPGHDSVMVSNLGRVKVNKNGEYRLHKQYLLPNGYCYIDVRINGKLHHTRIHRMVALAFIPNPYNFPVINHKDEVKTNNCVDNLEWCTQKYNCNYSYDKIYRNNIKNRVKPVVQYDLNMNVLNEFESANSAARAIGISTVYNHIAECCNGKLKTCYGFIFKWKSDKFAKENFDNSISKFILMINKLGVIVNVFKTAKDAAIFIGQKHGTHVSQCCIGKRKSTGGYFWIYYYAPNGSVNNLLGKSLISIQPNLKINSV